MRKFILLVSALLLLSADKNAWGQVQYTLKNLGTLRAGWESYAYGINNSGQVVGVSATNGYNFGHAFLYSGGVMQDISGDIYSRTQSQASGINNSGQVVGYNDVGVNGSRDAFLYSGGSMQYLGTLLAAR